VVTMANIASVKVIEKIGMKFEKVIKDLPTKYADYEGHHYYVLTKKDFLNQI